MVNDGSNLEMSSKNEEASMTHAVLARSNYNADKNLIQRHVKPETTKKLSRVVLA